MISKWDRRYIKLAEYIANEWSDDPSTKTGAVITNGRKPISLGVNGLPMGVDDTEERLNNRDIKYKVIIHCERNALIFAERSLINCTLYTWPFMSCATCASMMIQAGIKRIVAPYSENARWVDDFKLTTELFNEAGVEMVLVHPEELV